MSHTLITYQMVNADEPCALYLVPNEHISDQMRVWLNEAHNKLINCDECNDGMSFLSAATCPKMEDVDSKWADYACAFHQFKLNMAKPWLNVDFSIDHVYMSGFVF
jgi:hypothetical protein